MKILYLSCHEVLEYDEVRMFTEMGHEVYSHGAYLQPTASGMRPAIPNLPYNPQFISLALQYPKEALHPEMLEGIDMVIVMHKLEWITLNREVLKAFMAKGGRVVWRSIGQNVPHQESMLSFLKGDMGIELVGYSPFEETISGYAPRDAMIRFGKDPADWGGWNGEKLEVVNFTQSLKSRAKYCGYEYIMAACETLPVKVYGVNNDDLGSLSGGQVSPEQQQQILRDYRVYLYTGTQPASYTLSFMEAWLTGIPIVAINAAMGNGTDFGWQSTYEVERLLMDNPDSGIVAHSNNGLTYALQSVLTNDDLAQKLSENGRRAAIDLFSYRVIKPQWADFLGGK